jgi:hypothetical protein
MKKYYIVYFQDMGWAANGIQWIVNANSVKEAREVFPDQVRAAGFACTARGDHEPSGTGSDILEFAEVPLSLYGFTDDQIIDYYSEPKPCDFMKERGCSNETCPHKEYSKYGCYTEKHNEWVAKWGVLKKWNDTPRPVRLLKQLFGVK